MARLADGTIIDVSGEPAMFEHGGRVYVIGWGWFVEVSGKEEAELVIKRILDEPRCALESKVF
ncbi:MAG: hypothetical protein L3V56_08420 [Candidatus Magnetoovum sp. WYHC-5]|nr:hypothetical protein [Candidatus Magnetoovum sp. WYHC-5]